MLVFFSSSVHAWGPTVFEYGCCIEKRPPEKRPPEKIVPAHVNTRKYTQYIIF
jgi:hypothetical protein